MTPDELIEILVAHALWASDKGGARANLRGANLWGANLQSANLWGANLQSANLWGANLQSANLWSANLWGADLLDTNLRSANLWGADLGGADLRDANLLGTNLRSANLWGANLQSANLWGANLLGTNLRDAIGCLALPVAEPRKYRWVAVAHDDGWRVAAGCRWFTLTEARAHWLSPNYDGPQSVKETVGPALDWLEKQPLPEMETRT